MIFRMTTLQMAVLIGAASTNALLGAGAASAQRRQSPDYVALGSSFAAGPGIGAPAEDSPHACLQSSDNYAHRFARKRGLSLADRSCSGSTTADVLEPGRYSLPSQIDAVGPDTRLVTLTTGGNDVYYIGDLIAWSCETGGASVPAAYRHQLCTPVPPRQLDKNMDALLGSLLKIAQAVHARAPQARLVFLDYNKVLPDRGSCPAQLPLSPAQIAEGRRVATRLTQTIARAAVISKADLIEVSKLTQGHDVCSTDPWVSGWVFSGPPAYPQVPYHPTGAAMQAIADTLSTSLPRIHSDSGEQQGAQ